MSIAFVSGYFNVLHPGHLRLLRYASERAGRLIVGVLSSSVHRLPGLYPDDERVAALKHLDLVDEVHLVDDSIEAFLGRLRPDVVVKGREHRDRNNIEEAVLRAYGGRLIFAHGDSTMDVLGTAHSGIAALRTSPQVVGYRSRRDINLIRLRELVNGFDAVHVWTVGELLVADYVECEPLGMSREDASLAVTPIDSRRFTGGAGVVAAHVAGLGATARLCSIVGDDEAGEFAQDDLESRGVKAQLVVDPDRPTTVKERYRVNASTLLRVNHLSRLSIGSALQQQFLNDLASWAEGVPRESSAVLFADFNYGCLPQQLVDAVTHVAQSIGLMITADSQTSSQLGDVGRFRGVDLMTPTEHEARVAMRDMEDGLVVLADALQRRTDARNIFMTLGEQGVLLHVTDEGGQFATDQIPSPASQAVDTAGAGDSLIATATVALCAGANIWEAAYLGSLAAAIQVSRSGNIPIRREELLEALD